MHAHLRSAGLLPEVPGSRKLQPFYDREIAERVIRDIYRIEPSLPGAKI